MTLEILNGAFGPNVDARGQRSPEETKLQKRFLRFGDQLLIVFGPVGKSAARRLILIEKHPFQQVIGWLASQWEAVIELISKHSEAQPARTHLQLLPVAA